MNVTANILVYKIPAVKHILKQKQLIVKPTLSALRLSAILSENKTLKSSFYDRNQHLCHEFYRFRM